MTEIIIERISHMLTNKGHGLYGGEAVTQTEHALQCAALAENAGAKPKLITACLLHDVGHLLEDDFELAHAGNEDMCHEDLGEAFLIKWFGEEVCQPVKLHVDAKRYLCATNDRYFDKLSQASVHSLKLQGGPMSDDEVETFEANTYYKEAVRLRVWDDLAKDPDLTTPNIAHFMNYVAESLS
ncbi:MAG: phosphohydrolase [Hyphomicrobiales bacterium]|nr:MAG: phosphohydrolase [Hyphomicrobiales bacterium]